MKNFKNKPFYHVIEYDARAKDGRPIEYKRMVPHNLDDLIRIAIAMSNSVGGYIIFGIDDRTESIIGVEEDINKSVQRIKNSIRLLSLNLDSEIKVKTIKHQKIIIWEIKKASSTAYFSRQETTPARQIAYEYVGHKKKQLVETKQEMRYTKVYKYMTLDTFLASIYSKNWRFFEPSKWNDKFEQRFYCAKYKLSKENNYTPQLFATCVTREKNSEAAWKVYSHGQGLGSRCLQLELNIEELRKQIRKSGFQFEEKIIEYTPENIILNLHKKRSKYYKTYFNSFNFDSFLRLLTLKRDAFSYEKEIRFFIIPSTVNKRNISKKAQYKDIKIKWDKIIQSARIDSKCSDAELASIQKACLSIGISPIITNYNFIGNTKIPPKSKKIPFEKFDIDKMPGRPRIIIS